MAAALHSMMLLTGTPFAAGLGIIGFFSAAPQEVKFPVQCSKWNCFGLPKTHELLLAEQGSSASIHPWKNTLCQGSGNGRENNPAPDGFRAQPLGLQAWS